MTIPIRVIDDPRKLVRVKYAFCPKNVLETTISREFADSDESKSTALIRHTLESGDPVTFKGDWRKDTERSQFYVLVVDDQEAQLIPISMTLSNLKKTQD